MQGRISKIPNQNSLFLFSVPFVGAFLKNCFENPSNGARIQLMRASGETILEEKLCLYLSSLSSIFKIS